MIKLLMNSIKYFPSSFKIENIVELDFLFVFVTLCLVSSYPAFPQSACEAWEMFCFVYLYIKYVTKACTLYKCSFLILIIYDENIRIRIKNNNSCFDIQLFGIKWCYNPIMMCNCWSHTYQSVPYVPNAAVV